MSEEPVLAAAGITKRYEAVVALNQASLEVRKGEVMGLVGDNGAGKSTLVKCISGVVTADAGEILLEGRPIQITSPASALALGIETVYQDLSLVDPMNVAQNVFLGRELLAGMRWLGALRIVNDRAMRRRTAEVLNDLGVSIPSLSAPAHTLSGGQRQALAIARALLWGRRIVLLDEPTAALGVEESRHVLDIIKRLKAQGVAVLVISHNLQHLLLVADRVTVLRHGETVGVRRVSESSAEELVGLITGGLVASEASGIST